jgi:hypothetical protein
MYVDASPRKVAGEESALDPSVACTLSADGMAERIAWIRSEILPHVLETERLERGLAFELESSPSVVARLDHWVGLERECCSSIVFERAASRTPGRVRLEVRGIDPDAAVFRTLFAPAAAPPAPRLARLAKAAGAGVLGSLVVCCGLPLVAGALLGSAAAPLAGLDGWAPIAAGALLGTAGMWWRLGRSSGESPPAACGPGC